MYLGVIPKKKNQQLKTETITDYVTDVNWKRASLNLGEMSFSPAEED